MPIKFTLYESSNSNEVLEQWSHFRKKLGHKKHNDSVVVNGNFFCLMYLFIMPDNAQV